MKEVESLSLRGVTLPPDFALLRDHVRKESRRSAQYLERYDRNTLVYDCVRLPERHSYLFTAPRFLNLWKPFRTGLRVNGQPVRRVSRRTWLRCEQVEVFAPEGDVTLTLSGQEFEVPTRSSRALSFAGRNAILAVNKNNALSWIRDWAAFYVRTYGADALVLFDNGSTDYHVDEIVEAVGSVDGLNAALVYSAPFPYGPADKAGKLEVSARFFQTAMLNIARRESLSSARAVLSVDIDEIARPRNGANIFDMARRNVTGMVSIQGDWVFPPPGTTGPCGHRAHVYRGVPERRCNQKWCIVPGGPMSRLGWAVHQIGGAAQELLTRQDKVRLLHCKGTSTGWKPKRFDLPKKTVLDEDLKDFMEANFPEDA